MLAVYLAAKSAGEPGCFARLPTSCLAYFVIGTVSPAAMTFTPDFARSAGVVSPAGLAIGTMMVSLLAANGIAGPLANPPSMSFFGFVVSADRNTSAGAPCSICVSRADEESVEIVSVVPGLAVS